MRFACSRRVRMLSSRASSASGSVSFGTANASPTLAVATVSRSGSSLMNQVSANAATPIAAATRKTTLSESVNA